MRPITVLVLILVFSAPGNAAEDRLAAVTRFWEWSAYWGLQGINFPLENYRPGASFKALVFFEPGGDLYWGFCSVPLGICQAYRAYKDSTVYDAAGMRMRRGETEASALLRFQKQEFSGDENIACDPFDRNEPQQPACPITRVQTSRATLTLPVLGLPEAVTNKTRNREAEDVVRKVMSNGTPGCTLTVPFANQHYAQLPILMDCKGKQSLQVLSRTEDYWYPTVGGYIYSGPNISRLAARILSNASLVLKY